MYVIELSQRAQQFLNKLDKNLEQRIKNRLRNLKTNPIPSNAKFIGRVNSYKLFRYRIGIYRILYLVKDKERTVLITKIDKRPRAYDKWS